MRVYYVQVKNSFWWRKKPMVFFGPQLAKYSDSINILQFQKSRPSCRYETIFRDAKLTRKNVT